MKKNILLSLLVVAMGVMVFVGCEKQEPIFPNEEQQQTEGGTIFEDTINIGIALIHPEWYSNNWDCAFNFPDSICQVSDYDNGGGNAKWLLAINDEEMYREIFGSCNGEFPSIDFSNHTVYALEGRGRAEQEDICFKIINGKALIDVVIHELADFSAQGWRTVFYTDRKISDDIEYEINISKYPIE